MGWDVLVLVLYVDQFPGGSGSHDNSIRVCLVLALCVSRCSNTFQML